MRTRARAHTQQQSDETCNNSQHVNEMPAPNGVQAGPTLLRGHLQQQVRVSYARSSPSLLRR